MEPKSHDCIRLVVYSEPPIQPQWKNKNWKSIVLGSDRIACCLLPREGSFVLCHTQARGLSWAWQGAIISFLRCLHHKSIQCLTKSLRHANSNHLHYELPWSLLIREEMNWATHLFLNLPLRASLLWSLANVSLCPCWEQNKAILILLCRTTACFWGSHFLFGRRNWGKA